MLKSAAFPFFFFAVFVIGVSSNGFASNAQIERLGQSVNSADMREYVTDRMIVILKPGSDPEAVAREYGLVPDYLYRNAFVGFSAKMPQNQIGSAGSLGMLKILSDPRLLQAEADQVFSISRIQSDPVWSLDRIDQKFLPLSKSYSYESTGKGISIYVMDTGIRFDHQEFEGRAMKGFDSYGGDGMDCNGHGSHVAGTAAGKVYGVAKEASIYAVRIMSCGGTGSNSAIIAGIDWVIGNHNGPSVANFSITGPKSAALDDAVKKLVQSGVTVVVAAGNFSEDACGYSPGRVPDVINVGATDRTDRRWSLSNFGDCIQVFAPGHAITSVGIKSVDASVTMSGTSMAAPHVTGAAALYLELHPDALPAEVSDHLYRSATPGVVDNSKSKNGSLLFISERK